MTKLSLYSIVFGFSSLLQLSANAGGYLYCVPTNEIVTNRNSPYALSKNSGMIPSGDQNFSVVENGIWINGDHFVNSGIQNFNSIRVHVANKAAANKFCQILQQKCKADFGEGYGKYVGANSSDAFLWFRTPWNQITPYYFDASQESIQAACETKSSDSGVFYQPYIPVSF